MPVAARSLIMVPAWKGQRTTAELDREAAAGLRPRTDYVELAKAIDADVMDMRYLTECATAASRLVGRVAGPVLAQVAEAFARQRRYGHIVARADRLGLPLALLFKLTAGRRDLVLVSVWLSRPKKAVFLSHLKVHSHLGAIVNYGTVQRDVAATRLGVPPEKLYVALQPVDERFWRPAGEPADDYLLSVGSEARDYPTLARAIAGLPVAADLAIGSTVLRPSGDVDAMFAPLRREAAGTGAATGIRLRQQIDHRTLRGLYARARFVVVPLHDVDFDAGVTTITEAMAMGKAVIVTRTRGQVDIVRHGENGLYVPPADAGALRAAITRLLDDPAEADRMGRAGRALVESRHTLDGWVAAVAEVVAGRSRNRRQPAS
jgi:glycosyltransferase involved in cell wall biosynthesis